MNMGKTNKFSLREDETFAEVVKKYQCLYDKSFKNMKKDTGVKAVEKEIGLEEGRYC